MTRPFTARYVGYARGSENHGDEVLAWLIRDLLAPEINVVYDDRFPWDYALLGGGTLINQSAWLIERFREVLDQSRTGKGFVLGTGVGDPRFWGNHFEQWAPLLRRSLAVGVRGPHAVRLLAENGFAGADAVGDPYLALRPPVSRKPVERTLGVNLGSTNDSLWGGGGDESYHRFFADALRRLGADGWQFRWISVWSRDLPILERLREEVAPDSLPVLDARTQTLEAYSALAACQVFVGEKLHACAMAAVAGTPFIALEYQPKVRDFAASLGVEEWVVSTAERDPGRLGERVDELSARATELAPELAARHAAAREKINQFVERIKKIVLQGKTKV